MVRVGWRWLFVVVCLGLGGCTGSVRHITPVSIQESRTGDERVCVVGGAANRPVRVMQDPQRAMTDPRFQSWPRDAVVIEQRDVDGSWRTIEWYEARDGMVRWFPVDVDDDGTEEIALFRSTGRGNAGAEVVTILRSHQNGWYESFEVRTVRPVSIASPPSEEHPPYGYLEREVSFGRDAYGRTVVVVRTTADVPEGTALLDDGQIAEVARGVCVYRLDRESGGFVVLD